MSAVNPYAPPEAMVADVGGNQHFQAVRAWSGKGRIGRLRYLAHTTGAYLLMLPLMFAVGMLAALAGLGEGIVTAATFAVAIVYLVFFVLKTVQRSHDMDWSGWMSLLALIPFVGLIWIFRGGSEQANRFGAPTPPNTIGVKILAFMFPAIMVIGILAAIALPAYNDYTKRAKAAQMR